MKIRIIAVATVLAFSGSLAFGPALAKHRHHHRHKHGMSMGMGSSGPSGPLARGRISDQVICRVGLVTDGKRLLRRRTRERSQRRENTA
jgi:hypothetical protein